MCIQLDNFIVWEWSGEVRGWGRGRAENNRLEVIVSKFSLGLKGFYSSFCRHVLIQKISGLILQSMYIS